MNPNLAKLCVLPTTTIKEAMLKIGEADKKIILVVDQDDRLIGTVTDGDIRRGLISGLGFTEPVEKVTYKNCRVIKRDEENKEKKAIEMMRTTKVTGVPVVDHEGKLTDMFMWLDLFAADSVTGPQAKLPNKVVVMAGGKGTRLEPFTRILPKALIPINEKPIIEIIMDKLYQYGFHDFIFTLNYKKEYIKLFLRENKFPYNVDWVEEPEFLGTAGSLALLKDKITDTFLLTNCDIIVSADFVDALKWHHEHKNKITIIGSHREFKIPYGVLELSGGELTHIREKPQYDVLINTGVYIMEPDVLNLIPTGVKFDMNHLVEAVIKKDKVSVYPISEGWVDIGQWDEYHKSLKKMENL